MLKNFNLAFVGVNYHCIGNRPQTGSTFYLDDIDKLILKASCEAADIKLPYDVDKIQDYKQMSEIFHFVNNQMVEGKQKVILHQIIFKFTCEFATCKKRISNFGIMQAQDLLNVALYLKKHAPFDTMGGVYQLL
ncbi:motility accessory factor [Campylobacter jejuni]|nr:motility accessory factor [Campylobacter jejuni]